MSYPTSWSNEESKDQNEGEEVYVDPVALINIIVPKAIPTSASPIDSSSYKSFVALSIVDEPEEEATKEESGDEKDIFYEEMAHSYQIMNEKLAGAVTKNRGLLKHISLLNREKEELIKQVNELKDKMLKLGESLNELE